MQVPRTYMIPIKESSSYQLKEYRYLSSFFRSCSYETLLLRVCRKTDSKDGKRTRTDISSVTAYQTKGISLLKKENNGATKGRKLYAHVKSY
jgi:hypothetical protein